MMRMFVWIPFPGIPWDSQWPKPQGTTALLRARKVYSYQMHGVFLMSVDSVIAYHPPGAFLRVTKAARLSVGNACLPSTVSILRGLQDLSSTDQSSVSNAWQNLLQCPVSFQAFSSGLCVFQEMWAPACLWSANKYVATPFLMSLVEELHNTVFPFLFEAGSWIYTKMSIPLEFFIITWNLMLVELLSLFVIAQY